jgi:hypothetical protein
MKDNESSTSLRKNAQITPTGRTRLDFEAYTRGAVRPEADPPEL